MRERERERESAVLAWGECLRISATKDYSPHFDYSDLNAAVQCAITSEEARESSWVDVHPLTSYFVICSHFFKAKI
jgi:hypothetical protein